jgi:NADH-quinone oxidoreductase subunit C/D
MGEEVDLLATLQHRFGPDQVVERPSSDDVPTWWIAKEDVPRILRALKEDVDRPYKMLYDLTAIDERCRTHREHEPAADFTVVYHLLSLDRRAFLRLKVALVGDSPTLPSAISVWPAANWYEREAWDMFGIRFDGHPHLVRILMPPTWQGHPLRKDHPARATELPPFQLPEDKAESEQEALRFHPEDWGLARSGPDDDFVFLNVGPQHPGTHGVLRVVLQLDGEVIVNAVPDIGYHHRGAEKMGERQTWHTYIPYTDRVDYLAGVVNNLAYLVAVERLAGITVPPRARVIRVMLTELFRIISHLVWYGTFAQDLGQLSPVFFTFNDRERAFGIIEAVTGARMHPNWFRIGGVAQDLPQGWQQMVRDFLAYLPPRLDEYDQMVLRNTIFRARTVGVGAFDTKDAIEWGVTGPNLRACGCAWDLRKQRPYADYDQFEFEVPLGRRGDCYDRAVVRVEEMRQSLRIIDQCLRNMPEGPYQAASAQATPPVKARTMHDIETLITHFLGVSWGPVVPAGEVLGAIEATKGNNSYYLVSDGGNQSYRTRIRTPSFPHLQILTWVCRGLLIPDLLAILGSFDYVLADVDR